MSSTPDQTLVTAFRALCAQDADAFAALVAPESEGALRDRAARDLDPDREGPTEADIARSRMPAEMARYITEQVRSGRDISRKRAVQAFGVSDSAELPRLSLPTLVAGIWGPLATKDFRDVKCLPLGIVPEGDRAHVLFRLQSGRHVDHEEKPRLATLRRVDAGWGLLLDARSPFLFPALHNFVFGDRPPPGPPSAG